MSREIVKGERFQEILQCYLFLKVFTSSEMLLISACVFSKQFSKKSDALDPKLLHMMTFKTSYLVAIDVEQAVDKYILLDVLVCSIAEHFCELSRILTSPYGE